MATGSASIVGAVLGSVAAGQTTATQLVAPFKGLRLCSVPRQRATLRLPVAPPKLTVTALFGKKKPSVLRETVIPDPDYRASIVLLGAAGAFTYSDNVFAAAPVGLLGLLLLFQTTRVKFVFDNDSLEVKIGEDLQESGENVFVGGQNRWKYSSFINWEFWWPNFPVLVYFKESQTKPEGQIHFFPVIFNGKQVYETMVERCGPSKNSGPK